MSGLLNEVYIDKVELEHHTMAEHSNRVISPGYTECFQVSAHVLLKLAKIQNPTLLKMYNTQAVPSVV